MDTAGCWCAEQEPVRPTADWTCDYGDPHHPPGHRRWLERPWDTELLYCPFKMIVLKIMSKKTASSFTIKTWATHTFSHPSGLCCLILTLKFLIQLNTGKTEFLSEFYLFYTFTFCVFQLSCFLWNWNVRHPVNAAAAAAAAAVGFKKLFRKFACKFSWKGVTEAFNCGQKEQKQRRRHQTYNWSSPKN